MTRMTDDNNKNETSHETYKVGDGIFVYLFVWFFFLQNILELNRVIPGAASQVNKMGSNRMDRQTETTPRWTSEVGTVKDRINVQTRIKSYFS